ncbi:hypothetical protein ACHAQH_004412 [Verticillium albo-atrum]
MSFDTEHEDQDWPPLDQTQQYMDTMPSDVDEKLLQADQDAYAGAVKRLKPEILPDDTFIVRGVNTPLKIWQFVTVERMLKREHVRKNQPRGGALCSDMGMGKTLTMLTCILQHKPKSKPKTTLVVVPNVNIAHQWMAEARERCNPKDMVRKDAPSQGELDALREEYEYDPELPELVAKVYDECSNPLFKMVWFRVVLDEAHVIKNYRSKTAMAVLTLQKTVGWAITGTPVSNNPEELYPYWRFIGDKDSMSRSQYLEKYRDTSDGNMRDAVSKLLIRWKLEDKFRGKQMVQLPRQSFSIQYVHLSREETIINDALKSVFRRIINEYLKNENVEDNLKDRDILQPRLGPSAMIDDQTSSDSTQDETKEGARFLNCILRLRQAAIHPFMLEEAFYEDFTPDELTDLYSALKDVEDSGLSIPVCQQLPRWDDRFSHSATHKDLTDSAPSGGSQVAGTKFNLHSYLLYIINTRRIAEPKCMMCNQDSKPTMQGMCDHLICLECFAGCDSIQTGFVKCKTCNCRNMMPLKPLKHMKTLPQPPKAVNGKENSTSNPDGSLPSRRALKKAQKGLPKKEIKKLKNSKPGDDELGNQPVPSSVYRDMLRLADQVRDLQLTPSSKLVALKESVQRWLAEAPKDKIIGRIVGLRRATLNITCANRVIIMDPWWNSARESQAFGRVVRLGQEKETKLMRIVARGTIEDDIKEGQCRKLDEIKQALLEGRLSSNTSPHRIFSFIGRPRMENGKIVELVSDNEGMDELTEDFDEEPF